jgi:hypothetical protein
MHTDAVQDVLDERDYRRPYFTDFAEVHPAQAGADRRRYLYNLK